MNQTGQTTTTDNPEPPTFWRSRYAMGLLVIGAIATYFLPTEHRAHFMGAPPLLLLLACPLMHVFMHHGHGGHGDGHDHHQGTDSTSNASAIPPTPKTGAQP